MFTFWNLQKLNNFNNCFNCFLLADIDVFFCGKILIKPDVIQVDW